VLAPGLVLVEQYELIAPLGSGGQGSVWLARERTTRAERALKVVDVSRASKTARERAQREADQLVRLQHPAIVRCSWLFVEPRLQLLVLVLDFVRGKSLAELELDPRLTPERKLEVLGRVADALAHAHDVGIVHRDVKPQNILVADGFFTQPTRPDSVQLVDFGIAVPTGNPDPLTHTERIIGTRTFMAPEQLDPPSWGEHPDAPPLDVFAWGVTAWRLMVGVHPTGLPERAIEVDLVDAYRRARATGHLQLPTTPWTQLIGPALALDRRDRLRDGAALCRHLGRPSASSHQTTEVSSELRLPVRVQAAISPPSASPPLSTAGGTEVSQRVEVKSRRSPVTLLAVLGLLGAGALVLVVAVLSFTKLAPSFSPKSTSPWTDYVRQCCAKSPEHGTGDCSRAGARLELDERWWIRFQWARDAAGTGLQDSHPNAEVCAQPVGKDPTCWSAKPTLPARPLEATTEDLIAGNLQIWIRERGPKGTVVLDRMVTTYQSLNTGVLCDGLAYKRSSQSTIGIVVFSIEPAGEELSKYRGF
jgi:serine/threonine protein kinase